MKKAILKKTAGFLAALMLLTMLVPVLASAFIGFYNPTYSNGGNVTGQVYMQTPATDTVYVGIYSPTGTLLENVYARQVSTVNGATYYEFTSNVGTTYSAVYLRYYYGVGPMAYEGFGPVLRGQPTGSTGTPGTGTPGTGTPGTGTPGTGTTGTTIDLGAATEVTSEQLTSALAADEVTLTITGESLTLPGAALLTNEDAVVTISGPTGSISIPVAALDLTELATELGIALADLDITVTINVLNDAESAEAREAAEEAGAEIIGPVVDFTVTAVGPNGVSREIEDFGDYYVAKEITLTNDVDAQTSTAVVLNEETGEFEFVPHIFTETGVTMYTNHNSIYTVLSVNKELFADVPANHWAAADIQLLSNKLIVSGVSETQFQPTRNITRAEFAALVVRSLGLATGEAGDQFSDVVASAWYSEEVAAAAEAGLIAGYADGTFRPNQTITRAELAALVVRALAYTGNAVELTDSEQTEILAGFRDVNQVGEWARNELAIAVQAGIVTGVGADMLAPAKEATRAEATAMLARYLREAGFINE